MSGKKSMRPKKRRVGKDEKDLHYLYLKTHLDAYFSTSKLYDRAILSLSVASLGSTYVILKFIEHGKGMGTLSCSRIFFITSVLLLLIKLLLDHLNYENRVAYHAQYLQAVVSDLDEMHWTDTPIFLLTIQSGLYFLSGIIKFTIFIGMNVS